MMYIKLSYCVCIKWYNSLCREGAEISADSKGDLVNY